MIIQGDCLHKMAEMQDNSIDFIVCDPPYGLSFMGKKWDAKTPSQDIWQEALRICKPGAMIAAFGGSRTHHHLMIAIEKAGWEIRDVVMYLYGSGFPKSHNFGKKIGGIWQGYGSTLKPAYEPIIIAMKPLDGTFAQNAEKWGVAGINIDESRVETKEKWKRDCTGQNMVVNALQKREGIGKFSNDLGRWPANLILNEESAGMLDQMTGNNCSRFFYCAKASSSERNAGLEGMPLKECGIKNDSGRGFSESDPYKKVMYKNNHPTVKPLSLMKYILKLLAPPGNPICLDPFAGSGSTLIAAKQLGIRAIGIEIDPEYCEIAEKRIACA